MLCGIVRGVTRILKRGGSKVKRGQVQRSVVSSIGLAEGLASIKNNEANCFPR